MIYINAMRKARVINILSDKSTLLSIPLTSNHNLSPKTNSKYAFFALSAKLLDIFTALPLVSKN